MGVFKILSNVILFFCSFIVILLCVNLSIIINNNENASLIKRLKITLVVSIANIIPYIFAGNYTYIIFPLTLASMFISYYMFLERKIITASIYTFTHLIISVLTEYIGMVILNILKIPIGSVVDISNSSIINFCIIRIIPIYILMIMNILVYFFKYKNFNFRYISKSSISSKSIIVQIVVTVLLFCPNIIYFEYNKSSVNMLIVNMICAIILIMYGIFSIIKQNELAIKSHELYILSNHNLSLETALSKLRQFKHDYSNLLQSISGCIYLKDFSKLEKLFHDLKSEFSIVNTTPVLDIHFKNCPPLYGLLLTKVILSESYNIEMHLSVIGCIDCDRLSRLDIVKILGILIDNAIEAAGQCEKKFVEIKFIRSDFKQQIIISNSYKDTEIDLNLIYNSGFSTKEGHMGLGLFEVKSILKKSKDISLDSEIDKNFTQIININKQNQ